MRALLTLLLLVVIGNANAALSLWQCVGVFQYQQTNKSMQAQIFNEGNFLSSTAANSAVAAYGGLFYNGTVTPGDNPVNTKSKLDAICHNVIPPQLPGYFVLGQMQVKQYNQPAQPLTTNIGPFGTLAVCKIALNKQKTLTLQNTPLTDQNVAYAFDGDCYQLMD